MSYFLRMYMRGLAGRERELRLQRRSCGGAGDQPGSDSLFCLRGYRQQRGHCRLARTVALVTLDVPDVTGLTQAEAETAIDDADSHGGYGHPGLQ